MAEKRDRTPEEQTPAEDVSQEVVGEDPAVTERKRQCLTKFGRDGDETTITDAEFICLMRTEEMQHIYTRAEDFDKDVPPKLERAMERALNDLSPGWEERVVQARQAILAALGKN